MSKDELEALIIKPGVTYRILLKYAQQSRLLLRFQLAKDSSLYFFESKPNKVGYGQFTLKSGVTEKTVDNNKTNVLEDQLKEALSFLGSGLIKSIKMNALEGQIKEDHLSFHGSGLIKSSTQRVRGIALRTIIAGQQICTLFFPHASKLPLIKTFRDTDMNLTYPIDEGCPLAMIIIAAPRRNVQNVKVPRATFQGTRALVCERLLKEDDLVLLLHLYHYPGTWPDLKYCIYKGELEPPRTL